MGTGRFQRPRSADEESRGARARVGRRPRWIAMWGKSQLAEPWAPRPRVGRPSPPLDPIPQLSSKHWVAWGGHSPPCPQESRGCRCRFHVHADSERHEPHTYMPQTQAWGCMPHKDHMCPQMCGYATGTHTHVHMQREDLNPVPPTHWQTGHCALSGRLPLGKARMAAVRVEHPNPQRESPRRRGPAPRRCSAAAAVPSSWCRQVDLPPARLPAPGSTGLGQRVGLRLLRRPGREPPREAKLTPPSPEC